MATKTPDVMIYQIANTKTMAVFRLNVMANFDKLQFELIRFDKDKPKGQREIQKIKCYIPFDEALTFAKDTIMGRTDKKRKALLAENAKYPKPVWQVMGGANEQIAKEKGYRTDGKALSRVFQITPNEKFPYVIKATEGAGESTDKGLIKPMFGTHPDKEVSVVTDERTVRMLAVMIKTHLNAYLTGKYARREFDIEIDNNKK